MSLGLVSPILNRGVRSRWVSTLPASSKMLTIDAAGDVSYTDIPTAAWGSITGTLSSQTDLQNALNAKLSLTGGTMTGAGSAGTSTLRVNAGSGSSFTQINDNGTVVIDSDTATGTFPLTLKYAGTTVASVSYQGTITGGIGAFSSLSLDSGFVILDTDATNVLAQRNSTNAQTFRIYNTYTDASNYERGQLAWESNEFRIGATAAGTGTQRSSVLGVWTSAGVWHPSVVVGNRSIGDPNIWVTGSGGMIRMNRTGLVDITLGEVNGDSFAIRNNGDSSVMFAVNATTKAATTYGQLTNALGTITASTPMTLTQTWNNAAVTFNTLSINATDTASASGSTLADLRIGNQEKFKVIAKGGSSVTRLELWSSYLGTPGLNWYAEVGHNSGYGGFVSCPGGYMESVNIDPGKFQYISSVASVNYRQWQMSVSGNVIKLSQGTTLEWYGADYRADTNTSDLVIRRDAAQTLAQRNGANAQTFRIYNTFTDASNYERAKIAWESNVLRIGTEAAGTGTSRNVELQAGGSTVVTLAAGGATFSGAIATSNSGIVISECIIRRSSASGIIEIADNSENFKRLQLGGRTSSYPAIKRNGTAINFRLADDSADAGITASTATFSGDVTVSAANIVTDTTTGTKIGTATTQKIGFYNATPVDQPDTIADPTGGATIDAEARTAINALIDRLQELGLIAT